MNWSGLIAYAPATLLLKVTQKICQCYCLMHGWPGMSWILGLSAALNGDPSPITSVSNTPQVVPQPSDPQGQTTYEPSCLVYSRVDHSKHKASLYKWQTELLPLKGQQQGPYINQSGLYLRNGVESICWINPHPL